MNAKKENNLIAEAIVLTDVVIFLKEKTLKEFDDCTYPEATALFNLTNKLEKKLIKLNKRIDKLPWRKERCRKLKEFDNVPDDDFENGYDPDNKLPWEE